MASYTNLLYHLVFSTKRREPLLHADLRPRLIEYLGGGIRDEKGIALGIGGTADHVHMLAKLRQDNAVSDVVRGIKANSSGWIHRTFPELQHFAWQEGYGAFTVSQSQVEGVKEYIRNQEKHHQKLTFQEELVKLLRALGIEFDETYLWD
jgi:REP element-mobilizing transposase RayT